MLGILFVGYLTLLPFIVLKWGFEGPKLIYFFYGSLILTIFWIYRILRNPGKVKLSRIDGVYFLWLLILSVSSIFGIHPAESLLGGSYRHQGVIFFLGLWLVGKTVGILTKEQKILLSKALATAVIVEAVIVIVQNFSGNLYFGKSLGTLGEANAVAGFLVIGSYFVVNTFPKLYLFLPLIAIILSQSRSAIIALIPLLVRLNKYIWMIVIPAIILIYYFVSVGKGISPFENRTVIWDYGVKEIIKKPLLGYGAESGTMVYDNAFRARGFPLQDLTIDRAHNLFLDVTMWSGFIGLSVFGYWLYLSFVRIKDTAKKMAFISFLIFSMLQPLGVTHWVLFAVLLNIYK